MNEIIQAFTAAGLTAMAEILSGIGESAARRECAREFTAGLAKQPGRNQRLYVQALRVLES